MSRILIRRPVRTIHTHIVLPASKSIGNRLLLLRKVLGSQQPLINIPDADDCIIMQQALEVAQGTVNVKNAGTCMRFLTAYYASTPGCDVVLHGNERMHKRPVGALVEVLQELGADIDYINEPGFPPLRIKGKKLRGGVVNVDAGISSQFTSALMLVAPSFINGLVIRHNNHAVSRPYIAMTGMLMKQCGINIITDHDIIIKPFDQSQKDMVVFPETEPDWSAAGYWYVMAALCNNAYITLEGLKEHSLQGDHVIASYMERFGVSTTFENHGAVLTRNDYLLEQAHYDMLDYPDLVPAMTVLMCGLNITCTFTNVAHLEAKESKRLTVLCEELGRCGFNISHSGDQLYIKPVPPGTLAAKASFYAHGDHRMAMSFALLALLFDEVEINDAEAVDKSYPLFWDDLKRAGFLLDEA